LTQNNYHQFQPLLYQLATAAIGTDDIATSFRHSLRKSRAIQILDRADVSHIDWGKETEREDSSSTNVESSR
jgi:NADH dehydrogenase